MQRPKLPALYKYMARPFFLDNSLFRFSQPAALNDPHEALPKVVFGRYAPEDYAKARAEAARAGWHDIPDDELEDMFMDPYPAGRFDEIDFPGLWPAREPRLRDEPFRTINDYDLAVAEKALVLCRKAADGMLGILSLTESSDETMWAYYASDHRGIAVTFDTQHTFFSHEQDLSQVEYSETPVSISSRHGWVRIAGHTRSTRDILEGRIGQPPHELLLRKQLGWRHEREWRIIKPLREAHETKGDGSGIPICLFSVPPESIVAITFGYKASDDAVAEVLAAVRGNTTWHHLELRRREQMPDGTITERPM